MSHDAATLKDLARRVQTCFGSLDREEGRIALAVFRELAGGAPVEADAVARRADADLGRVREFLDRWAGVFRDEQGRVVGFWGLAVGEMTHRLVVGDRVLYGWCAWDCLFLPELLGVGARVESRCPATGAGVSLEVSCDGVHWVEPSTAVLSFVDPERMEVGADRVMTSFCHHVHFFASREAWEEWASDRSPPSSALDVEEGWRLGRMVNRIRYGTLIEGPPGAPPPSP